MEACCSSFYEQDWVRVIARDNFHPGGSALTRKLVAAMGLEPGAHILDLGCGTGSTALMLTQEKDLKVTGIDASALNIERAQARVPTAKFIQAEAANVPLPDASCDALIAECAFSLFADKPAVLAEARRLLRPGGSLGITDMAVEGRLTDDVAKVAAPWTCLSDALNRAGYESLFSEAGFAIADFGDESHGIVELIASLKRKLLLAAAGEASGVLPSALPLKDIRHWLDRIRAEVQAGVVRYYRFGLLHESREVCLTGPGR
jgi:ubiquinone/menaquinone biosynthesis C-methylase UbiE